LSVVAPIELALARTGRILFRPFDLVKWLKLGFCAFLATLLGDCGGGAGNSGSTWQESGGRGEVERAKDWVADNLAVVLGIGAVVFLVIGAFLVLLTWLQSRGRFMFLDGVVSDRGAVVEPWKRFRAEGNSLFRFSLALYVGYFVLAAAAVAVGLFLAWEDVESARFGAAAVLGLVIGGGALVTLGLSIAIVDTLLNDLVVPAMYVARCSVGEGWRVVSREVLAGRGGTVVLYLLMKLAIAVVTGVLVVAFGCGTLCIGWCLMVIPYVGTVVLLPILVFKRCYPLFFLRQLGGRWDLFGETADAEPAQGDPLS
jgi:hypothetical protein